LKNSSKLLWKNKKTRCDFGTSATASQKWAPIEILPSIFREAEGAYLAPVVMFFQSIQVVMGKPPESIPSKWFHGSRNGTLEQR
jgi:hypothetical protein